MRQRHPRFVAVAGMILTLLVSALAAADPVRVPGTKTSLEPPQGFSPSDRFPGFQDAETQSSIMVTELPAPGTVMMKGMTKEALASRGMTLISSTTEKVDGREALLLHVAQAAGGTEYLKWMLVTGDEETGVMVVGTFPKTAEAQVGAAIRTSVLTASRSAASSGDPFEGLSYRVTPTAKLKLAGRINVMLLLSESGRMGPLPSAEPFYIVGPSVGEVRIADLKVFSETRARQTEYKDIQNISGRAVTVGGLEAYELVADAKDTKDGTALRFYQVIVPEGDRYYIVQAMVGAERAAELLPEFRKVTDSLRRVTP
ncbi:MAG TPA: hypothetical protein VN493_24415 [Thermoanaerobaculia bacterium]|nr:hypothetical protein [Thermoanaerobaculia bacterium]